MTALDATRSTFLTFWPDGPRPNASSLNPVPGQPPTPNAVTTPLADGGFRIFNLQGDVNVIVDVIGFYTDENARTTTRTISVPADAVWYSDTAMTSNGNRGVTWPTTANGFASVTLARPPEWDGVSDVVLSITYFRTTDALGNVSFSADAESQADGEVAKSNLPAVTASEFGGARNLRRTLEMTFPAEYLNDGPWWLVQFLRDPTVANPYPGDINLLGITVTYEATS